MSVSVNSTLGGSSQSSLSADIRVKDGSASTYASVFNYTNARPIAVRLTDTSGDYVTSVGGGDGTIIDGSSPSIKATVLDYTNANPLAVRLSDGNGDGVYPLTDAQLRAAAVTVSGTVAVSGTPNVAISGTPAVTVSGAVAVTGPLTDTELRATAVPVAVDSGTLTAKGYGYVAGTGAAQGLAALSGGIPAGATYVLLWVIGGAVAWRDDGTDPTAVAGNGVPLGYDATNYPGIDASLVYDVAPFTAFKFITLSGSPVVHAAWYGVA